MISDKDWDLLFKQMDEVILNLQTTTDRVRELIVYLKAT